MTTDTTLTAEDWIARAAQVAPRTDLFIDGRFERAASGRTFDDIAGRDGSLIARVAEGDAVDVDRAVAAGATGAGASRGRGARSTIGAGAISRPPRERRSSSGSPTLSASTSTSLP